MFLTNEAKRVNNFAKLIDAANLAEDLVGGVRAFVEGPIQALMEKLESAKSEAIVSDENDDTILLTRGTWEALMAAYEKAE